MLIVLLGLLLRLCVSLHSYSGQNKPPMYGDYEAQRHWMEITYNLPASEWYFNTTDNDLMYWGLDYPPLTAYHSFLCGYVAAVINTSYVDLHNSRGLESEDHKYFMRLTVIVADMLTFIPAVMSFYLCNKNAALHKAKEYSVSTNEATKLCCLLALIYPGLILIDHGHFQYNCVSLGLFVFSVCAITKHKHTLGSVLFVCALAYKQMELYHALPFFFYLLGNCFSTMKRQGFLKAIMSVIWLGVVVTVTLVIICLPFVTNYDQALQMITRLFPIARGVFEDKVANVWCLVNIVYKLKMVTNMTMAKVCLLATCLAVIPSSYDVLKNNSLIKFKYSLINSALSFYLFSYQVHEKTILLAAVPVLLVLPNEPLAAVWFLCISVFSMLPLLLKDQLLLPYLATSVLFILTFLSSSFNQTKSSSSSSAVQSGIVFKLFIHNTIYLFYTSLLGCCLLTIVSCMLSPPNRFPDLFPLLISVYSCLHFVAFLIYFNVKQWCSSETKNKSE